MHVAPYACSNMCILIQVAYNACGVVRLLEQVDFSTCSYMCMLLHEAQNPRGAKPLLSYYVYVNT
jgi:hypothetical protein